MAAPTRSLVVVALVLAGLGLAAPLTFVVPEAAAQAAIPFSERFELAGRVEKPATFRLADLQTRPATVARVYYNTGSGPVTATFKGVLLWTLLQEAVIPADPGVRNDIIRRTVTVTASDGYRAVLSGGELAPQFGGEQAIIAYEQDGKPLDAETGGFARLIVPGDKAGGRNISSVVSIEVR